MQNSLTFMNCRYVPQIVLGTGTYGRVLRCMDTQTGREVAVKIARREVAYRRSAMSEVRVLQLLSYNDETVNILDFFEESGHICIVTELLEKSFYDVLQFNGSRPLSLDAVRVSGERVFKALAELHKFGYMHCDIKPENVMLRHAEADCRGKDDFSKTCLIDFGAVRQFCENTYYDIQSLWYRAPEVLLGFPYTHLIDSWSVGCLLFELYTGKPLFPGEMQQEQLDVIVRTLGFSSVGAKVSGINASVLQLPEFGRYMNIEANLCRLIVKYRSSHDNTELSHHSALEETLFIKLLSRLLEPDVRRRVSCTDALQDPFFSAPLPKQTGVVGGSPIKLPPSCCNLQEKAGYHLGCTVPFRSGDPRRTDDFENQMQQREEKRRQIQSISSYSGNCGTLPVVTMDHNALALMVPGQPHSSISNRSLTSQEPLLPGVVYQTPRARIVHPVQFQMQQPQPIPPPPSQVQQQQQQNMLNTPVFPMMTASLLQLHVHPGAAVQSRHGRTQCATMFSSSHHSSPQSVPMPQFDQELYGFPSVARPEDNLRLYKIYVSSKPNSVVYASS